MVMVPKWWPRLARFAKISPLLFNSGFFRKISVVWNWINNFKLHYLPFFTPHFLSSPGITSLTAVLIDYKLKVDPKIKMINLRKFHYAWDLFLIFSKPKEIKKVPRNGKISFIRVEKRSNTVYPCFYTLYLSNYLHSVILKFCAITQ